MKKAQDALAEIQVEGASGGGGQVTMTCRHDVKRVAIDPSLLGDDKDMLEDRWPRRSTTRCARPRRPRRKRWRR